jgi:hypothetical protein
MPRRLARLLLRLTGWLLTPLVLVITAAVGATIGLLVIPHIASANAGLIVTFALAMFAALLGLVFWVRTLREHPGLRHTLELTVEGAPDSPIVQRLIHPDEPGPGGAT